MARLQILQLPEGASDDRAPFLLIIDQAEPALDPFGAEEPPSFPDDLAEKIGARAVLVFETAVDIPANEILSSPDGYPHASYIEGDARQEADNLRGRIKVMDVHLREIKATICDALGIENNAAIDALGFARDLRADRDTKRDRMEAAAQLHQHVEHRGQTICGHCSDDRSPNATPVLWPCDTVKALTGYVDEGEAAAHNQPQPS